MSAMEFISNAESSVAKSTFGWSPRPLLLRTTEQLENILRKECAASKASVVIRGSGISVRSSFAIQKKAGSSDPEAFNLQVLQAVLELFRFI